MSLGMPDHAPPEAFDALLLDDFDRWTSTGQATFFGMLQLLEHGMRPKESDSDAWAAQKHKIHLWARATFRQQQKMRDWIDARRGGAAPEVRSTHTRYPRSISIARGG